MVAITLGPQPSAPGGTATQEFPPRAAEWQRLRLLDFSVSTSSALYIENRKPGEFFLYIFHDVVAIVVQTVCVCNGGEVNVQPPVAPLPQFLTRLFDIYTFSYPMI